MTLIEVNDILSVKSGEGLGCHDRQLQVNWINNYFSKYQSKEVEK